MALTPVLVGADLDQWGTPMFANGLRRFVWIVLKKFGPKLRTKSYMIITNQHKNLLKLQKNMKITAKTL
jgi:hypothetical protein